MTDHKNIDEASAGQTSTTSSITWPELLQLGHDVARGRRPRTTLDELFGGGVAEPIHGVGHLRLVTTCMGRLINSAMNRYESAKRPWLAKVFNAEASSGTNWLASHPRGFARMVGPRAKYDKLADEETLDGLPFTTWIGGSHSDAGHDVLHLDYASEPTNPALMRHATHDEVVRIGDGIFLGRVHSPPLRNRVLLYFALIQND